MSCGFENAMTEEEFENAIQHDPREGYEVPQKAMITLVRYLHSTMMAVPVAKELAERAFTDLMAHEILPQCGMDVIEAHIELARIANKFDEDRAEHDKAAEDQGLGSTVEKLKSLFKEFGIDLEIVKL